MLINKKYLGLHFEADLNSCVHIEHTYTDWQISENNTFDEIIWESLNDYENKNTIFVRVILQPNTVYYLRSRFSTITTSGLIYTGDWAVKEFITPKKEIVVEIMNEVFGSEYYSCFINISVKNSIEPVGEIFCNVKLLDGTLLENIFLTTNILQINKDLIVDDGLTFDIFYVNENDEVINLKTHFIQAPIKKQCDMESRLASLTFLNFYNILNLYEIDCKNNYFAFLYGDGNDHGWSRLGIYDGRDEYYNSDNAFFSMDLYYGEASFEDDYTAMIHTGEEIYLFRSTWYNPIIQKISSIRGQNYQSIFIETGGLNILTWSKRSFKLMENGELYCFFIAESELNGSYEYFTCIIRINQNFEVIFHENPSMPETNFVFYKSNKEIFSSFGYQNYSNNGFIGDGIFTNDSLVKFEVVEVSQYVYSVHLIGLNLFSLATKFIVDTGVYLAGGPSSKGAITEFDNGIGCVVIQASNSYTNTIMHFLYFRISDGHLIRKDTKDLKTGIFGMDTFRVYKKTDDKSFFINTPIEGTTSYIYEFYIADEYSEPEYFFLDTLRSVYGGKNFYRSGVELNGTVYGFIEDTEGSNKFALKEFKTNDGDS